MHILLNVCAVLSRTVYRLTDLHAEHTVNFFLSSQV